MKVPVERRLYVAWVAAFWVFATTGATVWAEEQDDCQSGTVLSIQRLSDGSTADEDFVDELPVQVVGWDEQTLTYNLQTVWEPTDGVLNMMATVFVNDLDQAETVCVIQLDVITDEATSFVTTTCDNNHKAMVDLYVHDDSLFRANQTVQLPASCTRAMAGGSNHDKMIDKLQAHSVGYRFEIMCACPLEQQELAMQKLTLLDEAEQQQQQDEDEIDSKETTSTSQEEEVEEEESNTQSKCACGCHQEDCHCQDHDHDGGGCGNGDTTTSTEATK